MPDLRIVAAPRVARAECGRSDGLVERACGGVHSRSSPRFATIHDEVPCDQPFDGQC